MSDTPSGAMPDTYDRLLGSMDGLPGVTSTRPATIEVVTPILGTSQTYIVRSFRQQRTDAEGKPTAAEFTLFVQHVEGSRAVKLAFPPKVAELILRQRDALTEQARRRGARAAAETRKARGIVSTFGGKRGRRGKKGAR